MYYWLSQAAAASTVSSGQVVEPVPAGRIVITGFAPGISQNTSKVIEPVPAGQIQLSPVAPLARTRQKERIPPAALTFTQIAPAVRIRAVKRPPSARVIVSGASPGVRKRIYRKPPGGTINLSAYTPGVTVQLPGIERIPPGYLRLVSVAPVVRVTGKDSEKREGGGRRAVRRRRIMIGRRWYWVQSRHEEILLLQRYLKQKELELEKEQGKRNGPAKRRKIKAIAAQISRTKTRITKAQTGDAWDEEEELLLMLIA